ncbi:hypothetical protein HNQ80_002183 [Anaerosolibacter carboniphilus]|uniref:Uncharacterized protein n=1 Tax=Anaerosolibacter carboniphilus TaxID=1417629 RepID=A0A841KQR6_9FIRM|nr:hypothetical protein [Anaerosolibacter carboniphilus]MBB6216084.1 hypothetical protein [Anaerosolibacter carboniphilus]
MGELHKKNNFYFWEKKIRDTEDILFGNIDKKRLTRESLIVYIGILDSKKGLVRSGWSSHGDVNTALGFLQHVFLPTAFYTWIDRKSDGFYIPLSPFHVLREEVLKSVMEDEDGNIANDAIKMEKAYNYLNSMWKYDDAEKRKKLIQFCSDFNLSWDQEPEKKLFVRVFEKSEEIVEFILENIVDEFEEVIEEELEMSIEQLRFMCEHAYDESLINKNIIELLNIRIPIWF